MALYGSIATLRVEDAHFIELYQDIIDYEQVAHGCHVEVLLVLFLL